MSTHSFSLVLDHVPTDDELDALYEAGLDDATPATVSGNGWLHVDREAPSMLEAVASALRDVHNAGLKVTAVHSGDLVSLKEVARRTGRTYEAVRLWSLGRRGPGGFPPPVTSADGWSLFSWAQVSTWLRSCRLADVELDEGARTLAVIDLLSRAAVIAGHVPAVSIDLVSRLQGTEAEVATDDWRWSSPFPRQKPRMDELSGGARRGPISATWVHDER